MGSDAYRDELRDMTRALLAGLERAKDGTGGDETALLQSILECVGDLRRLEEPIPPWCSDWLAKVPEAGIRAALVRYQAELDQLPVPTAAPPPSEDGPGDEGLSFAFARRDQVESALRSVTEWSLRRGRAPVLLPEWSAVLTSARNWEEAIGAVLDRATAESLLSVRIAIVEDDGWLSRLPEADSTNAEADQAPDASDFGALGAPDDSVLDQYLSRGVMQRYVEGYAAASPDFAESLAENIETLADLGELGDALVPRRWLKRYRGTPIRYAGPPLRLAAADTDATDKAHRIALGQLPGLAGTVYASIEIVAESATLHVDADDGIVKRVSFGGVELDHPNDDGAWSVQCIRGSGALKLRIEDSEGGVFDEELELHEGS